MQREVLVKGDSTVIAKYHVEADCPWMIWGVRFCTKVTGRSPKHRQ